MSTDDTATLLEREAARSLADAIAALGAAREPGHRERHRRLLDHAIEHAERAERADHETEGAPRRGASSILARAHAARAEDALHGAGQLSLSAQRAPTEDACDEGWQRVEALVAAAEASARAAAHVALALENARSPRAARDARLAADRAEAAARAARRIVDERNHAYTFHTNPGFSFGEGWYLAAAAVLAGAAIQIEPGHPATAQAERFLLDAGVGDRLRPHRSRPRANKATTDLVARAFRRDPRGAQRTLRAAFLGDAPIAAPVRDWIDPRLAGRGDRRRVLVWVRDGAHHPNRNSRGAEVVELCRRAQRAGMEPILVGDPLRDVPIPEGAVDMILFWKDPIFRGIDGRRAQLHFFEHLRDAHGVVGQVGVTTAGMDGPALMGMQTLYLTDSTNVRMRAWVGAVPGYRELVREGAPLERVSAAFDEWLTSCASTTSPGSRR